MKKQTGTREQLANELEKMRQRIAHLDREVTVHKQAEKELLKSELGYRLLAENVTDVIWTMDMNLRFTYISPSVTRRYGYSVEEAMAIPIEANLTPSSFKAAMKVFKEEMAIEKMEKKDLFRPRTLEVEQYRKDGSTVWSELEIAFLRDADGQAIGIVGVSRDITERKRAEEALRESEEKYRTILETIEEGYYEVDLAGNLTFLNDSLCRMHGYPHDELMGMNNRQYLNDETAKAVYETFDRVYRTGEPARAFDWEIIRKDGTKSFAEASISLMRGPSGEPVGFRGIIRDITERKRAEEKLRESEEKFRSLVENAPYMIFIADREGKILFVNYTPAGFNVEDTVGTSVFNYVPAEHREEMSRNINGVFESGEPAAYEIAGAGPDGTTSWYSTRIGPIKHDGHIIAVTLMVLDITERKRAEEELRESEEKYRLLINNLIEPLTVYDSNGHILLINVTGAKNLGSMPEDVVGKSLYDFFPDTADVYIERARRVFESGVGLEFEDEVPLPSGNRWFYSNIQPVKDTSGKVISVQNISYDITERKQAEEALRESEEKLRLVFESITDGIVVTDLQGKIVEVNEAVVQMAGISRAEIINKDGLSLLKVEEHDDFIELGKQLVQGDTPVVSTEREMSPMVGSAYDADLSLGTLRDSAGNPTGYIAVIRDVTERKRAEKELRESEEKLHAMFEAITDGIVVTDLRGKITEVNDVVVHMSGLSREEIIGQDGFALIPREDRDKVVDQGKKIVRGETGPVRMEHEVSPYVGSSSTTNLILGTMHDSAGNPTGFVAIAQDITERKRAEQERERLLEKLEDKSEELEQLVFIASHDLRSPLVNIQGFAREIEQSLQQVRLSLEEEDIPSALKEKLAAPIGEDITDSLNYILSSSSKIDSMLTGLLKVSRLGRVTLTIEKINMKDLMAEVVGSFEFQTREAGVKLEVGRLPQCRGDRAQLDQVFSNLIDNALKFLDPKRPGIIRISGRKEDRQAVYTVEDNGVGIAPEHHKTVFQIFRRFTPMDTPGEGLGLNIVRRILERHGGKIWLESEPGKGSRFHVSLPIRD